MAQAICETIGLDPNGFHCYPQQIECCSLERVRNLRIVPRPRGTLENFQSRAYLGV